MTPGPPENGDAAAPALGGRAINAAQWQTASSLTKGVVQFGITVLLARLLSPEDFGLGYLWDHYRDMKLVERYLRKRHAGVQNNGIMFSPTTRRSMRAPTRHTARSILRGLSRASFMSVVPHPAGW